MVNIILFICVLMTSCNTNRKKDEMLISETDENPIHLEIWTIWGNNDILAGKALQNLVDDYMKRHPEVQITITTTTTETYKSKLPSALAVNEGPDIFFVWGYGFAEPIVKSGKAVDLTPYVQEMKENALSNTFDALTYEDKIYGLPLFGWIMGLYCNTEMFDRYNIKIPETYSELTEAVKEFRKHCLTPMALPGREPWAISFYYMALAEREAGLEKIQKIAAGQEAFDDPSMISAAYKLKELKDLGAFSEDYYRLLSYEADSLFLEGFVPMHLNGSWLSSTLDDEEYSKLKGKVKIIPFPVITEENGTDEGIGGYVDSFMINAESENKEEAIKLYLDIMPKLSRELTQIGMGLPVWKDVRIDKEKTIYQFLEIYPEAGYHAAYDQILPQKVREVHLAYLQDLLEGRITPEEFVSIQAEEMKQYQNTD